MNINGMLSLIISLQLFRSFWATLYKAHRPTIQQNVIHLDMQYNT